MNKLTAVILISLLAGCSCRSHRLDDTRAMLAPSNLPQETSGPYERVHFAFDSSLLTANSQSTIKNNLALWRENGSPKIELAGNCDERGTNEYNMALGMKRANSTLKYIEALGEDRRKFTTVSYGEELPVDPAHNEIAWAKNRAVEFGSK